MPNAQYTVVLYPVGGGYVNLNDFIKLDCVLIENGISAIEVTLPMLYDDSFFVRDARLAFYRQPASDALRLVPKLVGNTFFLMARRRKVQQPDGSWLQIVTFVHPNHLLSRRVIAYDDETAEASKTAEADDLMKAIVRENFTAATDTTRNWASTVFAVESDLTAGHVVQIACSYRTVLDVLQEVCAQSAGDTTGGVPPGNYYAGFEITGTTRVMTFRTYVGQRGVDRSSSSGQPLIISAIDGSLVEVELDEDYTQAASFAYALGEGAIDERAIGTWEDSTFSASSPYGRTEVAVNQAQTDTGIFLEGVARRALWERRPRKAMLCKVAETEQATFGEEYDWGDKVVAQFWTPFINGTAAGPLYDQRDARVDPVRITVDRAEDPETGMVSYTEHLDIHLRSDA